MMTSGCNVLAAGSTGARNELKFFESSGDTGEDGSTDKYGGSSYKSTYCITEFNGGV